MSKSIIITESRFSIPNHSNSELQILNPFHSTISIESDYCNVPYAPRIRRDSIQLTVSYCATRIECLEN